MIFNNSRKECAKNWAGCVKVQIFVKRSILETYIMCANGQEFLGMYYVSEGKFLV